jgi:two-component system sensor histidine kinase/response regulator
MSERNRIVLLIIDDNQVDRHIYRRYLEHASAEYEVHEAEDAKSGLDLARQLRPNCVLLDLRLNQESGFEILSELAQPQSQPRLPVIILTAAAWKPLEQGAMSLGAHANLVNGRTDADTLDRTIREAIDFHSGRI